MYIKQTVKKPTGASPGAASPKDPNVTIIDVNDILSFPKRDTRGVKMEGNFVMKEGATMIQLYMTASKIKATFESEGEEDAISFKPKFEGEHPGDSLEVNEFIQNWMGRDVIIIYGSCSSKDKRVYGSPCAPLQLKPTSQDDNEARKKTFVFEQFAATNQVPGFYEGSLSFAEPKATGAEITVKEYRYKVAPLDATAPITFKSVALEHGEIVTLIGSGGADPAVLSASDNTAAVPVFLKEGASWTALPNAVINLQVYKAGAKTMLLELSRG